jgi:DNA (cytosine-5)-methyltransferase 1
MANVLTQSTDKSRGPLVAFGGNRTSSSRDVSSALSAKGGTGRNDFKTETFFADSISVRRMTPREWERLMGWPDDWTRWRSDGTEIADGPRYRMIGNGVVVPIAKWIASRIFTVLSRQP